MKNCPICKAATNINEKYIVCPKIFFNQRPEFSMSPNWFTIENENFFVDYDVNNNVSNFGKFDEKTSLFQVNGKFKIINNSVEDTYNHYRKFQLFS